MNRKRWNRSLALTLVSAILTAQLKRARVNPFVPAYHRAASNEYAMSRLAPNPASVTPVRELPERQDCDADQNCDIARFKVYVRLEDTVKSLYFCGHHFHVLRLVFAERGYEVVELLTVTEYGDTHETRALLDRHDTNSYPGSHGHSAGKNVHEARRLL